MQDASRASLRLLAASDPDEPPLRVVIAADVDDARVTPRPEADRAVVAVRGHGGLAGRSPPCTWTAPTPSPPCGRPPR